MIAPASSRPALALLGVMLAASAVAAWLLPADVRVPIHFDLHLRPDGWAGKTLGLLALPLVAIAVLASATVAGRRAARASAPLARATTAMVGVFAMIHLAIVGDLLALPIAATEVLPFALAILLVALGNVMGKLERNWVIGLRTPWSLADDGVWRRTQRFTGRLFVAVGLAGGLAAVLGRGTLAATILLTGAIATSLAGMFVSWRLASKTKVTDR